MAFRFSIGAKIFAITLLTSLLGLAAVTIPLLRHQLGRIEAGYTSDLSALAQVSAGNLAPYLDFDGTEDAERLLANLLVRTDVVNVTLLDKEGSLFARQGVESYHPRILDVSPQTVIRRGTEGRYIIQQPVIWKSRRSGTLIVVGDINIARGSERAALWQLGIAASLAGVILAFALSAWLQRFVSRPVRQLAEVAANVGKNADYSQRAKASTDDEVGRLAAAFNEMLDRIQSQERELASKVAAIASSEARTRSIIENLSEVVLLLDLDGKINMASPRARAVLSWNPERLIGRCFLETLVVPHQQSNVRRHIESAAKGTLSSTELDARTESGELVPLEIHVSPFRNQGHIITGVLAVLLDISDRRQAAFELAEMNRKLVASSRTAGMAEVATNVLHNVGNAFNGINVGVSLLLDRIRSSKTSRLRAAIALLQGQGSDAGRWIDQDPSGKNFTGYLDKLCEALEKDDVCNVQELRQILAAVEHIKRIISTQQNLATGRALIERLDMANVVEDVLRLESASLTSIRVDRQFGSTPPVRGDRHKVFQILLNLVRNGIEALVGASVADPTITITIRHHPLENQTTVTIADNGNGIPEENLARIFAHGFTTKDDGHGFGLHYSALAASEMEGQLTAGNRTVGSGAVFELTLPCFEAPTATS